MLKQLITWPGRVWQGRFFQGIAIDGPGLALQKYSTGESMLYFSLLNITSAGSGHWPFKMFELKVITGRFIIWHVCVMGLIVGQSMKHDLDNDGNISGKDKRYTYWAFSALNHQNKSFGEII
jgi:hypothetical protein